MGVDPITWSMDAYTLVLIKNKTKWELIKVSGGYTSIERTLAENLTKEEAVDFMCEEVKKMSLENLKARGFK